MAGLPGADDDGPGQTVVAAQALTLTSGQVFAWTNSQPVALPNGLLHDATSLTIDITFHTVQGGVLSGTPTAAGTYCA